MSALSPSQSDRPFHGLWGLWEMYELKIKPLLKMQDLLVQWSVLLQNIENVADQSRHEFATRIEALYCDLPEADFDICRRGLDRLRIAVLHRSKREIEIRVGDMRMRILDQFASVCCVALSTAERERYEPRAPLFGDAFRTGFVSGGAFELDEAAKCLALSRSTAVVFHLMRLMEIAVRAVACCLAIPDPIQPADRSWGAVLKKVREGIDVKWPTVASRAAGDGEIFDALYASLDAVKNPWRNATMHPANKYTAEEAEHVFVAVRGFVMKLAARCDENGDPKA